jgi:peptidoglycan/xylan/chitin deacetylase (PgdA/CDA1 family)
LLAVLRREGVRATFFLNGEPGRRSPELVQQIACEGHELGNHLYYHRHIDRMSYREFSAQVEETAMLIAGLTGRTPRLIRPPYGKVTSLALLYALRHKTPIVLWSLDTEDSEHDLGAIRGRILRHRMRPGDIVLMHDDYHHVVQLTQLVLAQARLAGMGFATVSELTSIPAR